MKYLVEIDHFAEKHYIKSFSKKYKTAWERTFKVLLLEFALVNLLFDKTIAEVIAISAEGDIKICKTEFKIAGTPESRHGSGNRCIVAIHEAEQKVRVLLVYHKSDIVKSGNENAILHKANYSQLCPDIGLRKILANGDSILETKLRVNHVNISDILYS